GWPGAPRPKRKSRKRIRPAPAAKPEHLGPALRKRRVTAILADAALPGISSTPGIAGSSLRLGCRKRIDCKTNYNKRNHTHGCSSLCRVSPSISEKPRVVVRAMRETPTETKPVARMIALLNPSFSPPTRFIRAWREGRRYALAYPSHPVGLEDCVDRLLR